MRLALCIIISVVGMGFGATKVASVQISTIFTVKQTFVLTPYNLGSTINYKGYSPLSAGSESKIVI